MAEERTPQQIALQLNCFCHLISHLGNKQEMSRAACTSVRDTAAWEEGGHTHPGAVAALGAASVKSLF